MPSLPSSTSSSPDEANVYDPLHDGRGTSPLELVQTLWSGKWLILGLALLMGACSYFYWTHQPSRYQTSAVLLLTESKQFEQFEFSLPVDRSNHTARDLYFLRHSEVFTKTVARRLADSLKSEKTSNRRRTKLTPSRSSVTGLAAKLQRSVQIQRDSREVPAIKISVTDPSPRKAALYTNTYAKAYIDHLRASSNERLSTSRRFLRRQKDNLKTRLRSIEDKIANQIRQQGRAGLLAGPDSTGGAGIVGEARQIARTISDLRVRKEKINLNLDIEKTMLDSARARLKRIRPNLAARASSNTSAQLKETQEQIASLRSRIEQIQVQNETLGPDLRSELTQMKTRVKRLQKKSQRLADQYIQESLSTDAVAPLNDGGLSKIVDLKRQITDHRINITKLEARRTAIMERIHARKAALRQSPNQTLARLKRRKNTTEELFVSLSKSLQKIRVSAESTPPQAQFLQKATPPSTPIGPDVPQNVILSLLLGGTLGAGIVLLYERTHNRVREPSDIEQTGLGMFGVIPSWEPSEDSKDDRQVEEESSNAPSLPWTKLAAPCSPAAEAYRHVATNVRLGVPTDVDFLLVTSPYPKEGKSTTVANLGLSLSEAGLDVLLIDADLYGASLHHQFGTDSTPGLSDSLAEGVEAVQTIFSPDENTVPVLGDGAAGLDRPLESLHRSSRGRLGLLPSGTEIPQPSLLLQDEHLRSFLRGLQTQWDLILLDTPPILTYDAASRLAALSQLTLLVANADETKQEGYVEAADRASSLCPGPVAGMLNQYDSTSKTIYGYGYSSQVSSSKPPSHTERFMKHAKRGLRHLATGR